MITQKVQDKSRVKSKKQKVKTLCTIDTYDNQLASSSSKENKNKNYQNSLPKNRSKSKKKNSLCYKNHQKSTSDVVAISRVKQTTPKSRIKRGMSINQSDGRRINTEYSEYQNPIMKKLVNCLKKKLVFPSQKLSIKMNSYQTGKLLYESNNKKYYCAKVDGIKSKRHTLIKFKQIQVKKYYQKQQQAYMKILKNKQEAKYFLNIQKIIKQKDEWVILTDPNLPVSWKQGIFYLFLNSFKQNPQNIYYLLKGLSFSIMSLSSIGYSHNNINLQSICFPIIKGQIQISDKLKLCDLTQATSIKNKKNLNKMHSLYRTPPEILNYILFQQGHSFNRDHLQLFGLIREGWQIDMWSVGILLLQLMNEGPLLGEGCDINEMIKMQSQLSIRYSYLIDKLDQPLKILLNRMVSFNPSYRPHPRQLARLF